MQAVEDERLPATQVAALRQSRAKETRGSGGMAVEAAMKQRDGGRLESVARAHGCATWPAVSGRRGGEGAAVEHAKKQEGNERSVPKQEDN